MLLLLLEPEAGDEAELLVVSFVVLLLLELLEPLAGLLASFTVVLLLLPPPAGGVTVSDFCSHAARSAALARMQMYFFIGFVGLLLGHTGIGRSIHSGLAAGIFR